MKLEKDAGNADYPAQWAMSLSGTLIQELVETAEDHNQQ
jgi:hypothetical protein